MTFAPLYINFPKWIHPEIFPGIPVLGLLRWYGLMYIFAFATAYLVLKRERKEGLLDTTEQKATEDDIFSFITFGIIFLLLRQFRKMLLMLLLCHSPRRILRFLTA